MLASDLHSTVMLLDTSKAGGSLGILLDTAIAQNLKLSRARMVRVAPQDAPDFDSTLGRKWLRHIFFYVTTSINNFSEVTASVIVLEFIGEKAIKKVADICSSFDITSAVTSSASTASAVIVFPYHLRR